MMAKVKGYKNVKMVKGTVPQANGKNGAHGWCEIKIGKQFMRIIQTLHIHIGIVM